MIRDFLFALTAIIALELGARLALEVYRFESADRVATERAAERLAGNVRDIMINRGGPVAARTVYPILRQNHADLGMEIAILPSEITVESIRSGFDFEPRGIPEEWPAGRHHEARVALRAESFCTTCHTTARPGDVLGEVVVRRYRAERMGAWWEEARVISVVGMANVILHTFVLFFLLRLRMEPLLRLRSTVARLAKGSLDLTRRVEARSDDEFGELAVDLNHFLDRLAQLVADLDGVMRKVSAVNERLSHVSGRMSAKLDALRHRTHSALVQAQQIEQAGGEPSESSVEAIEAMLDLLTRLPSGDAGDDEPRLRRTLERIRTSAAATRDAVVQSGALREDLQILAEEIGDDAHYIGEILVLEERMKVVSESGQALLHRLRGSRPDEPADPAAPDQNPSTPG